MLRPEDPSLSITRCVKILNGRCLRNFQNLLYIICRYVTSQLECFLISFEIHPTLPRHHQLLAQYFSTTIRSTDIDSLNHITGTFELLF